MVKEYHITTITIIIINKTNKYIKPQKQTSDFGKPYIHELTCKENLNKGKIEFARNLSKGWSAGVIGHSEHTVRASPATTWYNSLLHYNINTTLFLFIYAQSCFVQNDLITGVYSQGTLIIVRKKPRVQDLVTSQETHANLAFDFVEQY